MSSEHAIPSMFTRVLVDYAIRNTSRITWELNRHAKDPLPATWGYQLQYNVDGAHPTQGWVDIGSLMINAAQLLDTNHRPWGKVPQAAYRVKLSTSMGVYYSPPSLVLGRLNKHDWLKVQEISRKHELLFKKRTAQEGFLLRRKRDSTPCTKCLDPGTGAVTLGKCTVCKGTRFVNGYWAAVPLIFCQVEPSQTREKLDANTAMEQKDATSGLVIAVPGLMSNDIWVGADSDLRYEVHTVKPVAQIRDVPVILQMSLHQLPFDDVAYGISLAGS